MLLRKDSAALWLACLLLAGGVQADFTVEVSGKVKANEGLKVAGTTVEVEAAWPDALSVFAPDRGPAPRWLYFLPRHDATGRGVVGADGSYRFTVSVTESMALRTIRQGRKLDKNEPVQVLVVIRGAGVSTGELSATLVEGQACGLREVTLEPAETWTGRVVDPDGNPVPRLKLRSMRMLAPPTHLLPAQFRAETEFETDAEGKFEVGTDKLPRRQIALRVVGGDWALPWDAPDWQGRRPVADGDFGDVRVVPGGSVKASFVGDEPEPVPVYWEFTPDGQPRPTLSGVVADGRFDPGQFPECSGSFTFRATDRNVRFSKATISRGKSVDLGRMQFRELRSFVVSVVDENNQPVDGLSVFAEPLGEGEPGAQRRSQSEERISTGSASLGMLATGKWRLTVKAGYTGLPAEIASSRLWLLPVSVEVDVPKAKSASIKIPLGAALDVRLLETDKSSIRFDYALAAPTGTPAAEALKTVKWNRSSLDHGEHVRLKDLGAVVGTGRLGNLQPGKWDVVVLSRELGAVTGSVDLPKGTVTPFDIEPEPRTLQARLTENGRAVAGRTLFVISTTPDGRQWKDGAEEMMTDANGEITLKSVQEKRFVVLPEHEWNVVRALRDGDPQGPAQAVPHELVGRIGKTKHGTANRLQVEIQEPGRVIVHVTVKPPAGFTVSPRAMWQHVDAQGRPMNNSWSQQARAGGFYFINVLRGKFIFATELLGGNEPYPIRQEFSNADDLVEQFTVEPRVKGLTVNIKLPAALAGSSVAVGLEPAEEAEDDDAQSQVRGATLKEKLTTFFADVPAGTYLVWARIYDANRRVQHAQSTEVSIHGNEEVTLTIADNTGVVELKVVGNPTLGGVHPRGRSAQWRLAAVFGSDRDGLIEPGDPQLCRGKSLADGLRVPSLPQGTYEVLLVARGFQPWTEEITVEAGKTTTVVSTPLAAASLVLDLDPAKVDAIKKANLRMRFEDASGETVSFYLPGGAPGIFFSDLQDKTALMIHNLHGDVAQVRLMADGHEDVVIEVKVEPGKTLLGKYEPRPRAD